MLLEQIVNNPQKALLYMERYINDGSPSGFTWINQTSNNTMPKSNAEFFYLDMICCEKNSLEIVGNIPSFFKDFGENKIFVHPDMSDILLKKGVFIQKSLTKVSPLSSSRTVKLLDYPGYIKLNYNGIIGRIDRSLTDKHAYASVEMTELLEKALNQGVYSKLSFFHESSSLIYRNQEKGLNIGMVYREETPKGSNVDKIKYIIPMFSLFAQNNDLINKCLLIQIIEKYNKNPQEYVINELIFNIIDNYFKLLLNEGIQPEWHSQNLLLGLDEDFSISSLIMRDLESIDIDQTLQHSMGIQRIMKCYPYKYLNNQQYNYQIKHSFMYDFKIGEYVFSPLLRCICEYFKLDKRNFENQIREYSKQYIKMLPLDFFPSNGVWYSFDKVLVDRSKINRPYIKNYNAKYRG